MELTSPFLGGNGKNPNKLCSRYSGWEPELPNIFSAIRDGNGNYQKAFPLFGTGTGNPKNSSCCSGTGIQGIPDGNYTGAGIHTYAWSSFILFHPLSSSFILLSPLSSSFISFHPLSSSFILFHPLSSSFILCYPLSSSFILCISLSSSFILFRPLSSVSLLLYFSCTHLCYCMFIRYESVKKQGCLKTMALPFRQRPW